MLTVDKGDGGEREATEKSGGERDGGERVNETSDLTQGHSHG